jgi:hypothetical protein
MSVSYNKFNAFVANIANALDDLSSNALKLALSNTAPSASDAVLADITEIGAGHGYSSGGSAVTITGSTQSGGLYKLVGNAVTFAASGGDIGPFQYAVLYDSTPAGGKLIGWYDFGSPITISDGSTWTWTPSPSNGILQIQ